MDALPALRLGGRDRGGITQLGGQRIRSSHRPYRGALRFAGGLDCWRWRGSGSCYGHQLHGNRRMVERSRLWLVKSSAAEALPPERFEGLKVLLDLG
jgi:hypothetical protein